MNFHHGSVAATVPLGSRRCQARRLTRSFRQSPTENRSRHPRRDPFRRGHHGLALWDSRRYRSPITDYRSLNSYVAPNCNSDPQRSIGGLS